MAAPDDPDAWPASTASAATAWPRSSPRSSNNTRWFRHNGPAAAGTDRRFGNSRIIFQYFAGIGWQFHPLSNFAKLNAIWTVDTPPSRRAQRSFARELIRWGVKRNGALTWEYYFSFSGSPAPWISALSQGTAIQSLARVGYRMNNSAMMRAAKLGARSRSTSPQRAACASSATAATTTSATRARRT